MVRSLMIVLGALSLAAPVSSFVPPSIASSALVPLAQPRSLSARAERCVAGVAAQTRVTLRGATFCARRGAHLELDMSASSVPTPQSIGDMMQEAARAVKSAQDAGLKRVMVEVPLPITGGTELDDWPGGQGQKYETLRPMVQEVLRVLGFSKEEAEAREFLGYPDDAIGVWKSANVTVVCFANPEVLDKLASEERMLVLVNHQFFLDQFSAAASKDFLASCDVAYILASLNMKGPGALPLKGVLKRAHPGAFQVCAHPPPLLLKARPGDAWQRGSRKAAHPPAPAANPSLRGARPSERTGAPRGELSDHTCERDAACAISTG